MSLITKSIFGGLQREPVSGLAYRLRHAQQRQPPAARLLLLHGVGGNETDLAQLAGQIDPRVQVLLVQAPLVLGPASFAWFQVRFETGGPVIDAEQADAARRQLITLVRALRQADGDAPAPTVVAGFSQGGILSASVGLSVPLEVAGFGLLSGRILPELAPHIAPAVDLRQVSAFIAHGHHDNTLPVFWAQRSEHLLTELGVPHRTELYPIGHQLASAEVKDFIDWLAAPLALD